MFLSGGKFNDHDVEELLKSNFLILLNVGYIMEKVCKNRIHNKDNLTQFDMLELKFLKYS